MNTAELTDKINYLVSVIRDSYPELLGYLDETPYTIPNQAKPEIGEKDLAEYLDQLNRIVKEYAKTRELVRQHVAARAQG